MRQYLIGLAAAAAVAVVSAPAMAGCGGCAARCVQLSRAARNPCGGYAGGWGGYGYGGGWGYATLPRRCSIMRCSRSTTTSTRVRPTRVPACTRRSRAISSARSAAGAATACGYYGYNGGPYANPSHHYYHGMPAVTTPTVYSYRRAYRPAYVIAPATCATATRRASIVTRVAPRASATAIVTLAPRYSVAPQQYRSAPARAAPVLLIKSSLATLRHMTLMVRSVA